VSVEELSIQHIFVYGTVSRTLKIKLYKTMLKLVVMYGCETWSMTEKDEI
jgi:hypothetical protein